MKREIEGGTALSDEVLKKIGFVSEGEGEGKMWWFPETTFSLLCGAKGSVYAPVCGCMAKVSNVRCLIAFATIAGCKLVNAAISDAMTKRNKK